MPPRVFIIICQYGISGIFHDRGDAIARAKDIHSNDEDEESRYLPVWVVGHMMEDDDASWDIGMFPDRIGEDSPGEWVSAFEYTEGPHNGPHKLDYPSPCFQWGNPIKLGERE